ncbi:ShlB/FhaC/HecB family hemolysin secretion/activation protein [Phenylobacterium sp.]|uniref:ShlB/FhaC/HecB family hemolysin secretion/activation protein n=1 Tax=Phenylobacterium sp. TaxID=1871053 RepID=UPI0025CC3CD3|nr:POTRA domain-containing protein [Phenylobacterium sp.]MBX3484402.1 ShlB/FhaC/HecB family hemolysin secretion/activation protein [Phenylobacterium sp.]
MIAGGRAFLAALALLGPGHAMAQVAAATPNAAAPSRQDLNPEARRGARPPPRDSDLFSAPTALPCPLASSTLSFRLQGVDVVGSSIDPEDARAAYARLVGAEIPVARICEIRDRLSLILFRKGRLARVEIPEQTISGGRLRIEVTEARIVAVRVRGDIGPAQDRVEAYLDKLRGMTPFDLDTAQRYLLLANDVPRVRVSAALRPSAEGQGAIDLEVQLSRDPMNYLVAGQNTGSESLGPWSVLGRADFNAYTKYGERTTLIAYRTVTANEQWIAQVVEEARVGSSGLTGRVSMAYGQSRPGGGLAELKLQGVSFVGTAEARYPLIRLRRYSVYASAGVDVVSQKTSFPGGDVLADDQLRVAWARLSGDFNHGLGNRLGVAASGSLETRRGFSLLGGSKAGDQGLSRIQGLPDAWVVRSEGEGHLIHRWFDLGVRGQAQWADKPALAYEELAVGDLTIGRGYEPAVLSGDRAVSGEVKLQARPQRIVNGVTISPFAFADASYIRNLDVGSETRVLRSAGAGLEARLPFGVRAQVEWARPFDKPFPNAPNRPSDRILFQLLVAG